MDWKKLVGSVAPLLGTALGGPMGGMAGKFLADKLGVPEDELQDLVETQDPEILLQIKNLDNDFNVKMRELGIAEEKLHEESTADARLLAIQTSLLPQAIIASIFIIGFIVVLYAVFSGEIELAGNELQMANVLIGILSAGIMQIMNFFFGSSSGSKQKTNLLGK